VEINRDKRQRPQRRLVVVLDRCGRRTRGFYGVYGFCSLMVHDATTSIGRRRKEKADLSFCFGKKQEEGKEGRRSQSDPLHPHLGARCGSIW